MLSRDKKDLNEITELSSIIANNPCVVVGDRVTFSWARLARVHGHHTTSSAYESAMSLMQDSLTFAPTLEMQHFRLVAMRDLIERLPSGYASYQLHTGQLKEAIETLERGRGLIWSEMRGLRTSIDQLHSVDSHLAERFTVVNRDLDSLTISGSPPMSRRKTARSMVAKDWTQLVGSWSNKENLWMSVLVSSRRSDPCQDSRHSL
jgi:hypothetical protein